MTVSPYHLCIQFSVQSLTVDPLSFNRWPNSPRPG